MSAAYKVYCKTVSKDLIPALVKRLNEWDMRVSIHPDFKFDPETDAGFLPFRFELLKPRFESLKNVVLKSGFEIYIDSFDLAEEKQNLQTKPGFFGRLLGKKPEEQFYADPETEVRLKNCTTVVSCVWHAEDSFEFRFAALTSAILAELTQGVCSYEDEIWYNNNKQIAENAFLEVTEFEAGLTEEELDYLVFEEW